MAKNQKITRPRSTEKKPQSGSVSEFDKLLRFIVNFRGRFALAFICGEDRRQRDGVLASLTDLLKEKQIDLRNIDLTFQEATDLLATLKQECRHTEDAAIVVTAVEPSLKSNFLASLNVQRDLISQQIKCPILFWVSTFALNLFAREAPDFYDFRQTVFEFRGAPSQEAARHAETSPQDSLAFEEPHAGSEERTKYLLTQLEKYHRNESSLGPRENIAYAELLEEIARLYQNQRHRTEALPYLEKALVIYRSHNDEVKQASVLRSHGEIYYLAGNQTKAEDNLDRALRLHKKLGNRLGQANALKGLGDVKGAQSDHAQAEKLYQQALPIYREIGDRLGEANDLQSLGDVTRLQNDYPEAEQLYRQALSIHREIGNRLGEANALKGLGDVKRAEADYSEAEQLYRQALPIHSEIGDRLGEANALRSLGDMKIAQTTYAEAEELILKAMGIFAAINDSYGQGTSLLSLANLHWAAGSKQKAESAARRARDLLEPYPKLVERADKIIRELS